MLSWCVQRLKHQLLGMRRVFKRFLLVFRKGTRNKSTYVAASNRGAGAKKLRTTRKRKKTRPYGGKRAGRRQLTV